jgi:dolichol kinase
LVAVSLLAVSAFVLIAYALARRRLGSPSSIRRALHVAVGAWTLIVTPYFHSLAWALVLPGLFLIVNASSWARPLFRAIEGTPERAKGLWTFPAGVVLVYVLFWESGSRPAVLAGLSALAFADPAAAMVGMRFGQRKYTRFGHGRTLEGSLAFLLVTAVGAGLVASGHTAGAIPWRAGVGCGLIGTVAEAITPSGWDNLAIPVTVAAAYQFLV